MIMIRLLSTHINLKCWIMPVVSVTILYVSVSIDCIIYVFVIIDYITYHNVYLYSHVYIISHHILCILIGIIACLHAVFNSPVVSVDSTSVLGRYRGSTDALSPTDKCKALEKNTEFQKIHKTHASKGQSRAITSDQRKVKHHFIAYVLDKEGKKLVELDGTKAGPVIVKEDCNGDLLRGSIREVKGKLERGEISQSLSMMTLNLSQE